MAFLQVDGMDAFLKDMQNIEQIPDEVLAEMLEAGGEVLANGQRRTARSMLNGPYSRGVVAGGVKLGKFKRTKGGASISVGYTGTAHGNAISEIAFVNEFGKRGQPARPFIATANELYQDDASEAAQKHFDSWLSKNNL